jgi:hypothetical protein
VLVFFAEPPQPVSEPTTVSKTRLSPKNRTPPEDTDRNEGGAVCCLLGASGFIETNICFSSAQLVSTLRSKYLPERA